jgi:small subunit ribosomal protein S18
MEFFQSKPRMLSLLLFSQILSLPCQVITPADLAYQTRTYQPRRRKKVNVAPSSSYCRHYDPFYQLDLDPRDFTANTVVLSEYLSEMGKIQGRAQTTLTAKNQRLLGKTIRRAKMMGIIPHLSILNSVEKRLRRR